MNNIDTIEKRLDHTKNNSDSSSEKDLKNKKQNREYKMYFQYSNEQQRSHTVLTNGARVYAEPLVLKKWIDSRSSEIKKAENESVEGLDMGQEESTAHIKEQLNKSHLEAVYTKCFTNIIREYGDQVGMVKRTEGEDDATSVGFDTRKLGHVIDFSDSNNLFLLISEKGENKMRSLLENPPPESIADPQVNLRFTHPVGEQDYLHDNDGQKIGFTVWVDHKKEGDREPTHLRKIYFLFAKDTARVQEEDGLDSVTAYEKMDSKDKKITDDLLDIIKLDQDNEVVLKENILQYIKDNNVSLSGEVKAMMKDFKWFPTDSEILEYKNQE